MSANRYKNNANNRNKNVADNIPSMQAIGRSDRDELFERLDKELKASVCGRDYVPVSLKLSYSTRKDGKEKSIIPWNQFPQQATNWSLKQLLRHQSCTGKGFIVLVAVQCLCNWVHWYLSPAELRLVLAETIQQFHRMG